MDKPMIAEIEILRRRSLQRLRVAGRTDESDDVVRVLALLANLLDEAWGLAMSADALINKETDHG